MKALILKSSLVLGISSILIGCVNIQPFIPKQLNENAKGISTVRSTPYGCKVLGEVEGNDGRPNDPMIHFTGLTLDKVREGALNDLRNNAIEVIGNSKKRAVLHILKEIPECSNKCAQDLKVLESQIIEHYRVTAQVFECGNKE